MSRTVRIVYAISAESENSTRTVRIDMCVSETNIPEKTDVKIINRGGTGAMNTSSDGHRNIYYTYNR